MVEHYQRLWRYTDWADARVIAFFATVGDVPEKCRAFMAHIAAAQQMWLSRLSDTMPKPGAIWPDWSGGTLVAESERGRQGWIAYASTVTSEDLATPREYRSLAGDPFHNTLADIMTHVVNHSTHHRAQIATAARAENLTPPPTDFIYFVREES
jgi:uncharacterized damage-inducible protein DinB